MRKSRWKFAASLVALFVLAAAPARATVYDYFDLTFTQAGTPTNGCCGPFDVSATLQTTPDGNNFDIVGITGTVTQNGTPFAITGLIGSPNDPGDYFGFDNIVYSTGGVAPFSLSTGGVGLYAAGISNSYPSDPSTAFNIYGSGGSSGVLSTTASDDVNTTFDGTYSITATPLPSTWTMLIAGFVGLGLVANLRTKRRPPAIAAA